MNPDENAILALTAMNSIDRVFRLLERATMLEKDGQRIEASTKYYEGVHLMRQLVSQDTIREDESVADLLREKIHYYSLQAQRLYFEEGSVVVPPPPSPKQRKPAKTITFPQKTIGDDVSELTIPGNDSSICTKLHKKVCLANARLERAIDLEESNKTNNMDSAKQHTRETIVVSYLSAAEAYLSAMKLCEDNTIPVPPVVQKRLKACLDRTEALKQHTKQESSTTNENSSLPTIPSLPPLPVPPKR